MISTDKWGGWKEAKGNLMKIVGLGSVWHRPFFSAKQLPIDGFYLFVSWATCCPQECVKKHGTGLYLRMFNSPKPKNWFPVAQSVFQTASPRTFSSLCKILLICRISRIACRWQHDCLGIGQFIKTRRLGWHVGCFYI